VKITAIRKMCRGEHDKNRHLRVFIGGFEMIKKELVQSIAEKTGETQKKIQEILELAMEEIKSSVAEGEKVTLMGFGTFETRSRKEKRGTNPSTRKPMVIPATNVPAFRPSQQFKDLLK